MAKSQALKILNEIKTATFKNAAQLPLKESAHEEWQGLGYQVGGLRLVSNMNDVDEILKVPSYAALPGVKSWILLTNGSYSVPGEVPPWMKPSAPKNPGASVLTKYASISL